MTRALLPATAAPGKLTWTNHSHCTPSASHRSLTLQTAAHSWDACSFLCRAIFSPVLWLSLPASTLGIITAFLLTWSHGSAGNIANWPAQPRRCGRFPSSSPSVCFALCTTCAYCKWAQIGRKHRPEVQSNWLHLLFLYLFLHYTPPVQYSEPGRVAGTTVGVVAAAPGAWTPSALHWHTGSDAHASASLSLEQSWTPGSRCGGWNWAFLVLSVRRP